MKLNHKRIAAVIVALIGVGVAYQCVTREQAAAWSVLVAAAVAAYMPQEEKENTQ